MPIQRLSLSQAIGSRWLTYTPAYAWLLPLWFSGSLLSTQNLSSLQEFGIIAGVNLAALAVVCGEYFLIQRTLWRRSFYNTGSTPLVLALIGGLVFGVTKAGLTVWGTSLFFPSMAGDLPGKLLASCALAIIVVFIVPVSMAELELYRQQRHELINRIISSELSEPKSQQETTTTVLQEFVEESLTTLASTTNDPEHLAALLDHMRENQVRPLSHQIWKREQEKIPEFTLANLVNISLSNIRFVAVPVLVGFVLLMGPSQLQHYGLAQGCYALALQAFIIFLGLTLANTVHPRGFRQGLLYFIAVNLILSVLISWSTTALFGPIPAFLPLQTALAVVQVLATLTFFTCVYALTRKTHKAVEQDLIRLSPDLAQSELSRAQQSRAERDVAQLLHSQVQNVLLAKSVALKEQMETESLTPTQRTRLAEQTRAELEQYLTELPQRILPQNPGTFAAQLDQVHQTWSPILTITTQVSPSTDSPVLNQQAEVIVGVINEALSNAVRHGLARQVIMSITESENTISICVHDDGVGPRQGQPGLGTLLYLSIPEVHWSLDASQRLNGAVLNVSFPAR